MTHDAYERFTSSDRPGLSALRNRRLAMRTARLPSHIIRADKPLLSDHTLELWSWWASAVQKVSLRDAVAAWFQRYCIRLFGNSTFWFFNCLPQWASPAPPDPVTVGCCSGVVSPDADSLQSPDSGIAMVDPEADSLQLPDAGAVVVKPDADSLQSPYSGAAVVKPDADSLQLPDSGTAVVTSDADSLQSLDSSTVLVKPDADGLLSPVSGTAVVKPDADGLNPDADSVQSPDLSTADQLVGFVFFRDHFSSRQPAAPEGGNDRAAVVKPDVDGFRSSDSGTAVVTSDADCLQSPDSSTGVVKPDADGLLSPVSGTAVVKPDADGLQLPDSGTAVVTSDADSLQSLDSNTVLVKPDADSLLSPVSGTAVVKPDADGLTHITDSVQSPDSSNADQQVGFVFCRDHFSRHQPAAPECDYDPPAHYNVTEVSWAGEVVSLETNRQLLSLSDSYWQLINHQSRIPDPKKRGACERWWQTFLSVCDSLALTAQHCHRPLQVITAVIRSRLSGSAAVHCCPTAVAAALHPLTLLEPTDPSYIAPADVRSLVAIHQHGVVIDGGDELDQLTDRLEAIAFSSRPSATLNPEAVFKHFRQQAAHGRVLAFSPNVSSILSNWRNVILSPSGVVYSDAKPYPWGRPILDAEFLNTCTRDYTREIDKRGFSTAADVALILIKWLVKLSLLPDSYPPDAINAELVTFMADIDSAFTRCPVATESVGRMATEVNSFIFVALGCWFGWEGSSRIFSHFTRAMNALHMSGSPSDSAVNGWARFLSICHVDDSLLFELLQGSRPYQSAQQMFFAIRALFGPDGPSLAKHTQDGYWSEVKKEVGVWIAPDVAKCMWPKKALIKLKATLCQAQFRRPAVLFSLNWAERVCGCGNWPQPTMKYLPLGGFYKIAALRQSLDNPNQLVHAVTFQDESVEEAAERLHQDADWIEAIVDAVLAHPEAGVVDLVTMLSLEDRLEVPGQAAAAYWGFGDACRTGFAFGIEYTADDGGLVRKGYYVPFPPEVILLFDQFTDPSFDPNRDKLPIFMGVMELMVFVSFVVQFRIELSGKMFFGLSDSSNTVSWWNSGYARSPVARMLVQFARSHCLVHGITGHLWHILGQNNDPFDAASRQDMHRWDSFNRDLTVPFSLSPECDTLIDQLVHWLPVAFSAPVPAMDWLLARVRSDKLPSPPTEFDRTQLADATYDWQTRIRAAASEHLHHPLKVFAPSASLVEVVAPTNLGHTPLTFAELQVLHRQSNYLTATDACCCAGGWSIAGGNNGVATKQIFDADGDVVQVAELMTGAKSLGHWDQAVQQGLLATRCDLLTPRGKVIWACARTMHAFMLRCSEACVDGSWCLLRKHVVFFDKDGMVVTPGSPDWKARVYEMQLCVRGSKTDQVQRGALRNMFIALNHPDMCSVRAVVEVIDLDLSASAMQPMFAWGLGEEGGVTRKLLADVLKSVAVIQGKPRATTSTHSLRAGGCTAYTAVLPYEYVRVMGRWESDVARRYIRSNRRQMFGAADAMIDGAGSDAAEVVKAGHCRATLTHPRD